MFKQYQQFIKYLVEYLELYHDIDFDNRHMDNWNVDPELYGIHDYFEVSFNYSYDAYSRDFDSTQVNVEDFEKFCKEKKELEDFEKNFTTS